MKYLLSTVGNLVFWLIAGLSMLVVYSGQAMIRRIKKARRTVSGRTRRHLAWFDLP